MRDSVQVSRRNSVQDYRRDSVSIQTNNGMIKWNTKCKEIERKNKTTNPWSKLNPFYWISVDGVTDICQKCGYHGCKVYWKSDEDSVYTLYKKIKCVKCSRGRHLSVDIY